jgi:hypothetical protein
MALSSRVANEKVDPTQTAYLMVAGEAILAGNPLVTLAGKVYNITTDGYEVIGVSAEDVAIGGKVKVQTGTWEFPCAAGVTTESVGQVGYFDTSGVVQLSGTETGGQIVAVERTGYAFVKIAWPYS